MNTELKHPQQAHTHAPAHMGSAPANSAPVAGGTRYTCPMHPEIVRDAPGSCPKCGMALIPILASIPRAAEYTCPMHPEVRSRHPGSCPKCGMALVPVAGTGDADDSELRDLTRRLWAGVALSIPLALLAMSPMIGIDEPFGLQQRPRGWIEFALGTPVVLWAGWPILSKFWFSLVHRALNMCTLIGLGVGLAYLFSLAAVFMPAWFPRRWSPTRCDLTASSYDATNCPNARGSAASVTNPSRRSVIHAARAPKAHSMSRSFLSVRPLARIRCVR